MSVYEYKCTKCKKVTEEIHSMTDFPQNTKCVKCGEIAKKILSTNAGFILKGPGDHWPSQQEKRKKQMTKNNIDAGNRGRKDWEKRMPKNQWG